MRFLLSELFRPSVGRDWYEWATIALAHVMLGALGVVWFHPVAVIAVYAAKEAADLARAAKRWDSAADLGFVALGTFYGAAWMPPVVFALVGAGAAYLLWRGVF